jgi:hypothetical protein
VNVVNVPGIAMDPLALLCILFAEGPTTLRSLHRAGIRTLENVLATSDWALAEILDDSPASGRRFLREAARMLGEPAHAALDGE